MGRTTKLTTGVCLRIEAEVQGERKIIWDENGDESILGKESTVSPSSRAYRTTLKTLLRKTRKLSQPLGTPVPSYSLGEVAGLLYGEQTGHVQAIREGFT